MLDTLTPLAARRVVQSIALVAGFAELAYAVMNLSAMPVYLKYSMGYGAGAVAGIGTAFLFCEGVMKGPFGIIGDRIGRKTLIVAGPLVSVVTSLLTVLVKPEQWYFFVLLRVLDGLGAAALWPAALAMIADMAEEDKRSRSMSLFNVMYMLGIAIGPFIGGLANQGATWFNEHVMHGKTIADPLTASFYVISVLFLATSIAAWWKIPNVRPHHTHEHETGGFQMRALVQVLKQRPETMLIAFTTFFGIGLILLLIKLFAMAELHIEELHFGALLLFPCLLIAALSVPLGTVGDRLGKPRAVKIGLFVCGISMTVMGLMRNTTMLVVGGTFIGIGFVIAFPAWIAYVSSTCETRQRGAVMGAVGTAQGLGAMIGAPLGGYLYEHANIRLPFIVSENPSHYVPFAGCALLIMISWLLALIFVHDRPRPC